MGTQQTITHPTTDADLPSFVHPVLADVLEDLQLVEDCWTLLRDAKERHLPREPKEPLKAYKARLLRSSYASFFKDAVIGYAGALSAFELRDAPEQLRKYQSAIDSEGNSLKAFWMMADSMVLKSGAALLTVDMPPGTEGSRTDELAAGRRPYLSQVRRENVVNWIVEKVGGRDVAKALTILEWAEVPKGKYGVEYEPRYRMMAGGDWMVVRLVESGTGQGLRMEVVRDENGQELQGTFTGANGQPLTHPPVVWYSSNGEGFGRGPLPLLSLANLTLDWFREYSDLKELLHKTAMPVPVRKGVLGSGPGGSTPMMILGPNSGLDLPEKGDFTFAEVTGAALSQHVDHLTHIETLIDRQTMSFLQSGGNKTATQSMLEASQLQASLASLAEGKANAMQSLFQIWCQFTGETLLPDAGIDLDSGVFDEQVTDEKLQIAERLYQNDLLTRASVVKLAARAHMLPPDTTAEDEIKALEEEERQREARRPGTPGVNDLMDAMPPGSPFTAAPPEDLAA